MGITEDYVSTGNWLFRYRSIIPLLLLLLILFYIYFNPYNFFSVNQKWTIICLIISGFGELIRIITVGFVAIGTSGRNTKKQRAKSLNTTGIYSILRHPLYLGNYFIWMGFLLFFYNFWLFIIISLVYVLYYERIMFAEENYLMKKFGDQYKIWSKNTPAIVPSFTFYKKPKLPFSFRTILLREYTGIFGLLIGFTLLEIFKSICINKIIFVSNNWIIISFIGIIFYLFIRSLKKSTHLLKVKK